MSEAHPPSTLIRRSLLGLNAINFFQAEMVGVLLPVLGLLLHEHHWHYDAIGIATAAGGFGTTPSPASTLAAHPKNGKSPRPQWRRMSTM
jgi:hypothetical protein